MAQNAKVFIWKETDETLEDPYPWKVGTEDLEGFIVIRRENETYQEAWEWLHENYVRETP